MCKLWEKGVWWCVAGTLEIADSTKRTRGRVIVLEGWAGESAQLRRRRVQAERNRTVLSETSMQKISGSPRPRQRDRRAETRSIKDCETVYSRESLRRYAGTPAARHHACGTSISQCELSFRGSILETESKVRLTAVSTMTTTTRRESKKTEAILVLRYTHQSALKILVSRRLVPCRLSFGST